MYHQLAKQNRLCCECPAVGCSIRPTGNLNKKVFEKLLLLLNPGSVSLDKQPGTDIRICTDHIRQQTKQTEKMTTKLSVIGDSQNRQEKKMDQVLNVLGVLAKDVQNFKAIFSVSLLHGTTCTPGPSTSTSGTLLPREYNKAIEAKINPNGIDEAKMRNGLEKDISSERKDGWIIDNVKQGCILLEMRTLSDTFKNEDVLNARLQTLFERILTAGKLNTSDKAEIFIRINVKSPLTTGEACNSSKYQSELKKKSEEIMASKGKQLLPQAEEDAREIKEEIKTRGILQVFQKNRGEIVECPKCRYKMKCVRCKSKTLIIQSLMSDMESDTYQIRHLMADYKEPTDDIESIIDDPCDVCGGKDNEDNNELVYCGKCGVLVHQACYNIPDIPDGEWFAEPVPKEFNPNASYVTNIKVRWQKQDEKNQEIPLEEIQSKNDQDDICLHVAAQNSDRKQISCLLDRISKASLNCIDSQNKKGMTPLFISATKEQFDAPIHIAASGGDQYLKTIAALLADETILLNSFNSAGYTALHLAVKAHGDKMSKGKNKNSINIIEKLIVAGVDPNLQETKYGKTPLMCAIETLDIALVEIFVKLINPKNCNKS
ncbi:unnamed protein product [Mytilus edulis]|uniref:PHD-type domain-containing protein n=1 Tax=Mytilus edulis TaxID=6550 RepID=A0A8S3PWK9_MYTED|nr:unnamed protein product [Mytilus edulis]